MQFKKNGKNGISNVNARKIARSCRGIEQIRTLVAGAMKTSARLRKTCTKLNNGDASVNTISSDKFEVLVAHAIKQNKIPKEKQNKISDFTDAHTIDGVAYVCRSYYERLFFSQQTWTSAIHYKILNTRNCSKSEISFDQLEKWLFEL